MRELKPYEELFDTYPLLRLVLPLAVGIAIGELGQDWLLDYRLVFVGSTLLFLVLAIVVSVFPGVHSRKSLPFLFSMSGSVLSLGVALQLISVAHLKVDWGDRSKVYRALIVDTPKSGEKVWQTTARIDGGSGDGKLVRVALMKTDSVVEMETGRGKTPCVSPEKLRVGDVLLFRTQISSPRNAGNPDEFDFAKWLRHQGISGSAFCFASEWKKSVVPLDGLPLQVRLLRWRDALVENYQQYFEGRELAVLAAMTLGDKTHLDATTRDIFSHTGVSHVLALSGFHLSVLFSIYQLLVLSLCRRRRLRSLMSVFGICGLWVFALLAGLPLSLVRAAIMFSIVQLVGCFRIDALSINNLSLAALLLLVFSPQSLFDVGFQLSFLSVFFIILLSEVFPRPAFLERRKKLKWFYELFAVSLCAQLGTAPLVAYYFHTLPIYGWVSNFVAVPLAYVILGIGLLFLVLPFARSVLVVVLGQSLRLMDCSLSFLSELPGAVIELYPTLLAVGLTYLCFYWAASYWVRHRVSKLFLLIGSLAVLFGIEFYEHRPHRLVPQIVFYNLHRVPVVQAFVSAERSYAWTTDETKADSALLSVKRTFWKKEKIRTPLWLTSEMKNEEIYYDGRVVVFNGCRVAFLAHRLPKGKPVQPLAVDYLLVARGVHDSLEKALCYYQPKCVVLDGSLTDYYRESYLREIMKRNIACHDMQTAGALRCYFE